jgi:hypothetical protein
MSFSGMLATAHISVTRLSPHCIHTQLSGNALPQSFSI